jgi:hypothetical protein
MFIMKKNIQAYNYRVLFIKILYYMLLLSQITIYFSFSTYIIFDIYLARLHNLYLGWYMSKAMHVLTFLNT